MSGRSAAIGAGCLVAWLVVAAANACSPPTDRATYVIHHETYGDIGSHVLTFHCEGDDLVVDTEVEVAVKLLLVTVYRRRARYHEVWRGDRLVTYEAWTDEAGEEFVTTARIEGDQLVIDGAAPEVRVPADTVSSHPWNIAVIDRRLLFGMKDGRLLRVAVQAAGEETIEVGKARVTTRKFVTTGDLERELWYDLAGNWLQWRLESNGGTVTLTRR